MEEEVSSKQLALEIRNRLREIDAYADILFKRGFNEISFHIWAKDRPQRSSEFYAEKTTVEKL